MRRDYWSTPRHHRAERSLPTIVCWPTVSCTPTVSDSPVVFIAATIVRGLQSVGTPMEFQALPVLLGLMGHMMNSVILAFVFSWLIAPRLRGVTALAAGGVGYGLIVLGWRPAGALTPQAAA